MKTLLLTLLIYFCGTLLLFANTWRPPERLLDALCQIESSGGQFVYGDEGRSLGHFQIQKSAWADVVAWRKRNNLPTHDYARHVFNPNVSRTYAADYLTILYGRLKSRYQREPVPAELYAAYNMGMTTFSKCNYDLARVNPTTRSKGKQITSLLE